MIDRMANRNGNEMRTCGKSGISRPRRSWYRIKTAMRNRHCGRNGLTISTLADDIMMRNKYPQVGRMGMDDFGAPEDDVSRETDTLVYDV
jgi:hypothetical protein